MRILTAILTIVSAAAISWAQDAEPTATTLTAEKAFAEAPEDVITLIDKSGRLDMLDYFHAGSDKTTSSPYGSECAILQSNNEPSAQGNSSLIYVSNNGLVNILFVLNGNKPDPIIGIIETSAKPIPDSGVRFYDKRWQTPAKPILVEPTLSDWLIDAKDRQAVAEALPFILAQYGFDPETGELTMIQQMAEYFVKGDQDEVLAKIKPQLTYKWDGKQFKLTSKK